MSTEQEPLKLKFLGALVEQLGAQLYPTVTATIAELISNSWDADARNVWGTVPFGASWASDSQIVVLDDGHGMTRDDAQNKYLVVGRKRRLESGEKTQGGRFVHGRKGIGKLGAFGTAEILECYTVKGGETVSFRLDYNKIRKLNAGSDYEAETPQFQNPLIRPDGEEMPHGTRIILTGLKLQRPIPQDQFMKSMSRRFAVDQAQMNVFVNGVKLDRFDMELAVKFPRDGLPTGATTESDGWARETLPTGAEVRWWIGFTPKPLEAEYLRGISILAHGKLVQRPFMFERSQGARGQLGQEYVVGEVQADWLDFGNDIEDDLILTNRDQLRLEDDRVVELLRWGRRRLDWALSRRADLREAKATESVNDPDILDLTRDFTPTEKSILVDIAKRASKLGDPDPEDIHDFMVEVVNGYKDRAVRELMEKVGGEEEPFQDRFWSLVREFSLIDARKNYSIIRARLRTIDSLAEAVKHGATEVPELHSIIKEFPWLIDPRLSLLGDEVNLTELGEQPQILIDGETGDQLDFLFVLRPKPPAPIDQVLVVEIKRGVKSNGKIHSVNETEIDKFHSYVLGVEEFYGRSTANVVVNGLMVANNYSERADRKRASLQRLPSPRFTFATWGTLVEQTRRLHTGWLEVTRMKDNPQ